MYNKQINLIKNRRELKNAQCGPCADWSSSLSACVTNFKDDTTTVGRFISVIRPAAVQLITDTTIVSIQLIIYHFVITRQNVEIFINGIFYFYSWKDGSRRLQPRISHLRNSTMPLVTLRQLIAGRMNCFFIWNTCRLIARKKK